MPEPFLELAPEERAEALRVAADASGRPADLCDGAGLARHHASGDI